MSITATSKITPSDSTQPNLRYPVWPHVVPLPPDGLMWSTGGANIENFLVLGDAWAQLISHFSPDNARLLDIGCGCGRTARPLLCSRSIVSYVGFDVVRESIDWCNNFITPVWGRSGGFYWYDLYSAEYNPQGKIKAQDLVFPVEEKSVDVVFACSLFTHLLEPDAIHYLHEIGRVLAPQGKAILSIHNNPAPGFRFSGTETRIDIDSSYFIELAASAHMSVVERIEDFGGQQIFILGLT